MTSSPTTIPGYELIRELGVGGMATVWLAVQRSLDRKVAIKVMKRNIDDLDKFERRFLQEGRTMAKLPHRNIVAVYDIVKGEDISYIAMEYLDGGTLSQKMKDGLSLGEAISVVVQIAAALQFAHDHGVVHRDLKPANIMFRDEQTPVLTDFGIAKQQDQSATRLTQTGMLVGTPTYMSPEQINALEVDGRSDLYSLGVLFYELLTGAPPFQADTPIAVLMAHLTTPAPPLPMQFADFEPVVQGMLAKSREDRFQDMREFTRALKAAVVNNQNLWARLQADPNASSSEQLRALGFSISGPQSQRMQGISSQQIRLPPSGTQRGATPSGGVVPPPDYSPTGPTQAPRSNKPLIAIGGAAAALGIAIALGIAFWPKAEIDGAIKPVVDRQLADFSRDLAAKDYASARDRLTDVRALAPNYGALKAATVELARAYRTDSEAALARKDYDAAAVALENARGLTPDDAALAELERQIGQGREEAKNRDAVRGLLTRVDSAERANRLVGSDGAYPLLQQARKLMPSDAALKQRSDAVVAKALAPVREALKRGDATDARTRLTALATDLANDPAFQVARNEVDAAAEAAEKRARVAGFLQRIDQQLAAGKLVTPPGDNARETLASAQALAANDGEVQIRSISLTAALVKRAQASLTAGNAEAALNDATDALAIRPDDRAAQQLRASAEGRLGANRAALLKALSEARQAIAAQRFLPPAQPNARGAIEAALKLDARNADAQQLLQELPLRIAEAAQARIAAEDLEGAGALLAEARKVYASDAKLAALSQQLAQQNAAAQAEAARTAQLERVAQQIATRPISAGAVGGAAKDIATLLAANPRDVDAVTLKTRLFDALREQLEGAQTLAEIDALMQGSAEVQKSLPNDPALRDLGGVLAANRTRVEASEKERLAALSGQLVLNAYPWGTVESVVDAQNKAVALPADATTPLTLDLPQGVYYVTFRHPQGGRRPREAAQVKAKQTVTASVSFAGSVTAKGYLERAGY